MSKRKKTKIRSRGWPQPVFYKVDPNDPQQLILRNGTRVRKGDPEAELYLTGKCKVYTLTRFGLRPAKISYKQKNNYCKKIVGGGTGHHQGCRYPYVRYKGNSYPVHILMAYAWIGEREKGKEVDHVNGNIRDCRKENIRYLDPEDNAWCGGILRRIRNAAKRLKMPWMNPAKREPEDMLATFERFRKHERIKDGLEEEIQRQKLLQKLRESAVFLRDPSLDPRNIEPDRLEKILSDLRVEDPDKRMEWEMTHHMEI